MQYRDLWLKYTVSTVLILPLFSDIIKNIRTKNNNEYSIHSLLVNCGLVNAYLYRKSDLSGKNLYLLFKEEKLTQTQLFINDPYESLLDILLNCKYFVNIYSKDEFIIIKLQINDEYLDDVKTITKSKYSEVSILYKNILLLQGNKVKSIDNTVNYLILKNIPAKIVHKNEKLEEALKEIINHKGNIDGEYFVSFEKNRETLNM